MGWNSPTFWAGWEQLCRQGLQCLIQQRASLPKSWGALPVLTPWKCLQGTGLAVSIMPNVSSGVTANSPAAAALRALSGEEMCCTHGLQVLGVSELWAASFPSGSIEGVVFSRQLPGAAQLAGHASLQGCDDTTGKLGVLDLSFVSFSLLSAVQGGCPLLQFSSHPSLCHCATPPSVTVPCWGTARQGHPFTLLSCLG